MIIVSRRFYRIEPNGGASGLAFFFAGIVRTLLGRFKSFALKVVCFSCVCATPPIGKKKKRRSKKQKLLPHVIRKVHSSHFL